MSGEQSLVGAMGCASWRSHHRLREHASLAPAGGVIRGTASLRLGGTGVLGLNEVGVTDLVMATIWRFGPRAAAYAVSPGAEANHLGADIAIVHTRTSRILLYQAKLARHDSGIFGLKSKITATQIRLLSRRSVVVQGTRFRVTGRIALYQMDVTPFISRCQPPAIPALWWDAWSWRGARWDLTRADHPQEPEIGRRYYEVALAGCGCSPGGVLAAPVPAGGQAIASISEHRTWPWEFDTYEWLRAHSPLDRNGHDGQQRYFGGSAPEFDGYYFEEPGIPGVPGIDPELAGELAEQLRLPGSTRLYLIVV